MSHDCGNDIAQYVFQSVFHVKVGGPTKAFFHVSPDVPIIRHLTTLMSIVRKSIQLEIQVSISLKRWSYCIGSFDINRD